MLSSRDKARLLAPHCEYQPKGVQAWTWEFPLPRKTRTRKNQVKNNFISLTWVGWGKKTMVFPSLLHILTINIFIDYTQEKHIYPQHDYGSVWQRVMLEINVQHKRESGTFIRKCNNSCQMKIQSILASVVLSLSIKHLYLWKQTPIFH